MAQAKEVNLDLLDKSIDDIDDLPGFETPVNGVYSLKFSTSTKFVNDKPCISCDFEVIECVEQNNPEETPTKVGTKFNTLHQIENETAMGVFKGMIKPVADHFGETSVAKLVSEVCKDLIVVAKVTRRKNKDDPDKPYANVGPISVA